MFAFIEHGQPHNHHGGENTITLSHASVRRPCQKLTKSLTSQVRASENISTLGRRSLRPSQRHQNPTLQIVAVKYGLHDQISQKTVRISPQLRRGWGPGMYMKMALVPKGSRVIPLSCGAGDGKSKDLLRKSLFRCGPSALACCAGKCSRIFSAPHPGGFDSRRPARKRKQL